MKKLWGYVVAAFGLVLSLFFYERTKRKSAEALNDNLDVKEKILNKQSDINKNEASLDSEAQKREDLKNNLKDSENEKSDLPGLVDFFNKRK